MAIPMVITRSGELTLASAQQLQMDLSGSLERGEPVVLDLQEVTETDLACLQVLLAARRSFTEAGCRLEIRAGECLARAWSESGYPEGGADWPKPS